MSKRISASFEETSFPKILAASIRILDFLKILLGLKKSPIPFVETPHAPLKEIIDGSSQINIETDPAPCVYSPVELSSYFAISEAITIACLLLPFLTQSQQFCRASTAPAQAKVRSTISQFLKHLSPYSSAKTSSRISTTYEEVGFEASTPLSVPRYTLPTFLGSILFCLISLYKELAAIDAESSS